MPAEQLILKARSQSPKILYHEWSEPLDAGLAGEGSYARFDDGSALFSGEDWAIYLYTHLSPEKEQGTKRPNLVVKKP